MHNNDTKWRLYATNKEAWQAIIDNCEAATKSIDFEQFIFVQDEIGKKFIDLCARKASQGVKVRLLWDAAGSFSFFGASAIDELKKKGIELVFFKTLFPALDKMYNYKSWYLRNHRRTLVIDSKTAFTGSICFSDEMITWRDTVVKVEGPVVHEMQNAFEIMWIRANKKGGRRVNIHAKSLLKENESHFKYITNDPLPRGRKLYRHILAQINQATSNIYITTPYFVPTRQMSRAIRRAALRGVNVQLLLPEWTDHPIVDLCSRTFFQSMLKSGVRIFMYKGEVIHSKTMAIDEKWSTVGTLNIDHVSLLYNFEANIVSTNPKFAKEVVSHFLNDLNQCEEIILEKWQNRYWFEKIIGFFLKSIRWLF